MTGQITETSVFAISGVEYAFGLEWLAAARSPSSVKQMRRKSVDAGATHLAWRPPAHQVGVARILSRQRAIGRTRWISAASVFADLPQPPAEPHAVIAAFPFLSGEIWLVAASHGRLFIDGDRLFTDLAAAKEHFRLLYDRVPRWGSIFAPAEWGYPRANPGGPLPILAARDHPRFLSRIAGLVGPRFGLHPGPGAALRRVGGASIEDIRPAAALACAALAIAVVWGGAHIWVSVLQRRPALPPIQEALSPWFPEIVDAGSLIAGCTYLMTASLTRSMTPGWDIGEATCDKSGATVSLSARSFTPLSSLASYHPDAQLESARRTASLWQALPEIRARSKLVLPLSPPESLFATFGRLDEQARASNSFSPPAPPVDPPPVALGVPRPRPYRVMNWTLSTAAPPEIWAPSLAAIANLDIAAIALKRTDLGMIWTIKGGAYVSP